MRSGTPPHVDWNEIPAYAARAHALRSAEVHRLLRHTLSAIVGLAQRLVAPGGSRRPSDRRVTGGPAPSSP